MLLVHGLQQEGLPDGVKYFVGQLEAAPTTGKEHLQGYVQLTMPRRLPWLKENLSHTAHWEAARGSAAENKAYCAKSKTRLDGPWEFGEVPAQGKRNDLLDIKKKLDRGVPFSQVQKDEDHYSTCIRYGRALSLYAASQILPRDSKNAVICTLMYGKPGMGKSRAAEELASTIGGPFYRKPPCNKWFDGYQGENTIVFDDFTGSWLPWGVLMQIMDRYATKVEIKGGFVELAAKNLIFTTNIHPRDWYDAKCPVAALARRFTQVALYQTPEPEMLTEEAQLAKFFEPKARVENAIPGYAYN